MTKILFVYEHQFNDIWQDGLNKAVELLGKDFSVEKLNLFNQTLKSVKYDFVLGWGAFGSRVDRFVRKMDGKKGLCIAGNSVSPTNMDAYDILFYETNWYKDQIKDHRNIVRAFGINGDVYKNLNRDRFIDYLSVGAFAYWKRQVKMLDKDGYRMVIGEIQRSNIEESYDVIDRLLKGGVMVGDMIESKKLAELYNSAKRVYIPADINGGGERAVWEAMSCGCKVDIEDDNPKLKSLLEEKPLSHIDYYKALKNGINSVIK